jgi:hypothetical protein
VRHAYPPPHQPGFWQNETGPVLRPAVMAYLRGETMTGEQIAAMRQYLAQWIAAPAWAGRDIKTLRAGIDGLTDVRAIQRWLDLAAENNIDPL